jgi:hypothetical protein
MMYVELYMKPLDSIVEKCFLVCIYHIYSTFGFVHLTIVVLLSTSVTVFSQYHYNQTHSYHIVGSHWLLLMRARATDGWWDIHNCDS